MRYQEFVKPVIDRICAALLIFLLSPLYLVLFVLVRRKLGSPAIFAQQRPGYKGKPFVMYKFRSMTDECDEQGELLPDADRLPKFGRILRSTSLDELPELWNVFRGDMSFIGPRPLLMQYLPLYSPEQMRRHDAKPGITGWAQVNGRNNISWPQKFALDTYYVDHCNFLLDVKIIGRTILNLIRRDGIAQEGQATVEYFKGQTN